MARWLADLPKALGVVGLESTPFAVGMGQHARVVVMEIGVSLMVATWKMREVYSCKCG